MTTPRKILTLHPPLGDSTLDGILTSLEGTLLGLGASRIWVESECYPDLTVMAAMPELMLEDEGPELVLEDEGITEHAC